MERDYGNGIGDSPRIGRSSRGHLRERGHQTIHRIDLSSDAARREATRLGMGDYRSNTCHRLSHEISTDRSKRNTGTTRQLICLQYSLSTLVVVFRSSPARGRPIGGYLNGNNFVVFLASLWRTHSTRLLLLLLLPPCSARPAFPVRLLSVPLPSSSSCFFLLFHHCFIIFYLSDS